MREIKFRAWNGKEMSDGETIAEIAATWPVQSISRLTLQQFTGLKDKNGKEIYEGDMVEDPNVHGKQWVIEYRTDTEYVGFIPKEVGTNDVSLFVSWRNMRIVGNIWEKPTIPKKAQAKRTRKRKIATSPDFPF